MVDHRVDKLHNYLQSCTQTGSQFTGRRSYTPEYSGAWGLRWSQKDFLQGPFESQELASRIPATLPLPDVRSSFPSLSDPQKPQGLSSVPRGQIRHLDSLHRQGGKYPMAPMLLCHSTLHILAQAANKPKGSSMKSKFASHYLIIIRLQHNGAFG